MNATVADYGVSHSGHLDDLQHSPTPGEIVYVFPMQHDLFGCTTYERRSRFEFTALIRIYANEVFDVSQENIYFVSIMTCGK